MPDGLADMTLFHTDHAEIAVRRGVIGPALDQQTILLRGSRYPPHRFQCERQIIARTGVGRSLFEHGLVFTDSSLMPALHHQRVGQIETRLRRFRIERQRLAIATFRLVQSAERPIGDAETVLNVRVARPDRSEEHTSELPSLMRTSYAVICLT